MDFPYTSLVDMSTYDIAIACKAGIGASYLAELALVLGTSESALSNALGVEIGASSIDGENRCLFSSAAERVLGLARMIGALELRRRAQVSQPPLDEKQTAFWLGRWLEMPASGLGGCTPMSMLDTVAGQEAVAVLLRQLLEGVVV